MNDTNGANNVPSHVVGIGASAGGLEALQSFFSGLRNDTGAAFVVVQHLSPDYKSMMSELLAKHTEMTIFEVEDSIAVEANCIYLMPPRKNMLITEGKLLLSDQMPDGRPHMSIDVFLRSLAEDQQHRGISIVLSGTGTDGTRGIRAMKETGGLVVIQKPDSAKFDGMPKNAFNTGLADMVLAPEDMGEALSKFISHPSITGDTPVIEYADSEKSNDILNEIFALLKEKSSINFSQYKPSTVARRIERRLGINQLTTLEDYLKLLVKSPRELQILSKELLIGVTRFFRDTEAFERLKNLAVKRIIANTSNNEAIRVWIAGCSSGEEAYSIAIMLNEAMEKENCKREIKIFATDVDDDAISEASTGTYSHEIVQDISEDLLEKYFTLNNGVYTVRNYLRQMVIFAVHNMIEDPPFSNVSLVSCRNALIYFQQSAQKKVLTSFHFALRQGGILFLGNSESLGDIHSYFEVLDERNKLFSKVSSSRIPFAPEAIMAKTNSNLELDMGNQKASVLNANQPSRVVFNDRYKAVREKLIFHYAPDCIIINEDFEAIHVYGDVSRYVMRLKNGKVSTKIKDMIKDDLSVAVSTALYRCEKNEEDVYYKDVTFDDNGEPQVIDLAVFVVKQGEHKNAPRAFVLQFIEPSDDEKQSSKKSKKIVFDASEQFKQRIDDLELELLKKQEHLQVTVEELETTNEELQSANEELMSANEELQSTNEELQSVNEELYTVNSEYQEKIRQLTEANSDLDNVINSTDIGILFLDGNLTIRKFTPHVQQYINVRASDVGRPIHHISHELEFDGLLDKIAEISQQEEVFEKDVFTKNGQANLLRIMPYAVTDPQDGQQGVLITITNVSRLRFVENALEQAKSQFKLSLQSRAQRLKSRIEKSDSVSLVMLDDDEIFCESASRMLQNEARGFGLVTCQTSEDCLGLLQCMEVDLLILDYQLAGETAEDVVQELKQNNFDLPIILLTNQNEQIMSESFLENDVVDVISKDSMSKEVLTRSVDYALERLNIKALLDSMTK